MNFTIVKSMRLFEEVSRQIGEQIQSGRLLPGEKLPNERDLASTFAVSRHVVREALRSLESLGQIELRKGAAGGAFVANGGPQPLTKIMQGMVAVGGVDLEQLTEARLAIESAVIRAACDAADEAGLAALDANIDEAERQTLAGHSTLKTQINVHFHILVAELTGNPILIMMMRSLMSILSDFIAEFGSVMGVDVIRSRRRFMKHMRARNAERAAGEMESHLKILHQHYLDAAAQAARTRGKLNG
ncbi:FadR/GntR family transcriptional regulator [Bradyrhizobium sp. CCBAU 51753]|uniref:FadR/GntR family transcriptional regulator n=1 Tax=Bradyrhizobium sp. CCBAU 51753 TaxID=1325100 RepID=UPI00188AC407|nr:GntR family transcriptional regulator [Bradyrhizobium sp. CCBAU 51753]QOZ23335.1 FadR family transcriptional regulator [Bradyrhizobium sp. CCBAU 51753]